MSADAAVPVPLYVSMAAIIAAYRAGTITRALGVTSPQLAAVEQHINAAETMLRAEFGEGNVVPFIQRAMTTSPKLPPGDAAGAAISLAGALVSISTARRHFDAVEHSQADAVHIANLRIGHDHLIRFTAQMDSTMREHVHAVLESIAGHRGTASLLAEPVAPADGAA